MPSDIPRRESTSAKLGADDQISKGMLMGPSATGHRRINGEDWGRGVGWGSVITSFGKGVREADCRADG